MRTVFTRAVVQLLASVALGGLIVSTLLLGAGVVAFLVPVRRVLAIDPAAAMKSE